MSNHARKCVSAIVLALIVSEASGYPEPLFDLDRKVRESELVAVVKVRDVQREGPFRAVIRDTHVVGTQFMAICDQLAILKGDRPGRGQLVVHFPHAENVISPHEALRRGENAIVFLRANQRGEYVFTDSLRSKVPLAGYSPAADAAGGNIKARITVQLVAQLDDKQPDNIVAAVHWANQLRLSLPEQRLIELTRQAHARVRAVALAELIRRGDRTAIGKGSEILLQKKYRDQQEMETIAWALERVAEHVPVATANQMAMSDDAALCRIAVRILSRIGNQSSVRALVNGLNAKEPDTQYAAILGLGRIVDRDVPAPAEFYRKPGEEIAKWKAWWTSEGESQFGSK